MRDLLICVCLAAVTAGIYARTWNMQFVNYDDEGYVYENPHVMNGLSWPGVKWAFETSDLANYHPLTWISFETDASLWGANPRAMHLENAAIHAVNTVLLFLLLRTAGTWPAALAAAIFAVHPLHVESVAWISERKDLLSGFFFLLACIAYLNYATARRKWPAYLLTIVLFALGLLAKPMIVTFPFVLMLLDFWPLKRGSQITEKIPLLAMSVASCVLTIWAQGKGGAIMNLPLATRTTNAIVSYGKYVGKFVLPVRLSIFYPYPSAWPVWEAAACASLLLCITVVCAANWRTRPWLIVGWLWFLGMLTPTIGIVQAGWQAMADRYMYLPLIGVAIMAAWTARRFTATNVAGAAIAVAAMASLNVVQQGYWQDTRKLFEHALDVTTNNAVAHVQLGYLDTHENDPAAAMLEYQEAIRIDPTYYVAEFNAGNLLLNQNPQDALEHYNRALHGNDARVWNNRGIALARLGNMSEAELSFRRAIERNGQYADAHCNLGSLLLQLGQKGAAREQFQMALRIDPNSTKALQGLETAGGALN